MTDITGLGWTDDVAFVQHLIEDIGVAAVPGSSFYRPAATHAVSGGLGRVRFCFCKKEETLAEAERRLARLTPR